MTGCFGFCFKVGQSLRFDFELVSLVFESAHFTAKLFNIACCLICSEAENLKGAVHELLGV